MVQVSVRIQPLLNFYLLNRNCLEVQQIWRSNLLGFKQFGFPENASPILDTLEAKEIECNRV